MVPAYTKTQLYLSASFAGALAHFPNSMMLQLPGGERVAVGFEWGSNGKLSVSTEGASDQQAQPQQQEQAPSPPQPTPAQVPHQLLSASTAS